MQSLLSNQCIKYVVYDEGSGCQTGEIAFHNGEIYDGEIFNERPLGWGKLVLTDGCYYEGHFDQNGITEGKFVHFTRDTFEGKFLRDRFDRGILHFCDGDVLNGEWANERGKWVLKNGQVFNEDNIFIGTYGPDHTFNRYESKGKEVFKSNDKNGFSVLYPDCFVPEKTSIKKLTYTADGLTIYENQQSADKIEKVAYKCTASFPFKRIDQIIQNTIAKIIYQLCYGIRIETDKDDYSAKLTFNDLSDIAADGQFDMEKMGFKFTGELKYKKTRIGELNVKKGTFSGLKIKLSDKEFPDINAFNMHILEICAKEFNDVTVYRGLRPSCRKKSQKSAEVMKDMINDIKDNSNCVIM